MTKALWCAIVTMVATPMLQDSPAGDSRTVNATDGEAVRIRMAVAGDERNVTTTVALPEDGIATLVSGWRESDLAIEQSRGSLHLKLLRKAEGHLTVVGASGRTYRLYLEPATTSAYDGYVRILGGAAAPARAAKPIGALELVRAMRLGQRPPDASVFAGDGRTLLRTDAIEASIAWVYVTDSYVGYVLTASNLSQHRAAVDVSRFAADNLVLSGSRDQLLEPGGKTLLYLVFWRRP